MLHSNGHHLFRAADKDSCQFKVDAFRAHQSKKYNTYWEVVEEGYVTVLKYFTKYQIVLRKK